MIYHCVYTPNTAETVERNVPVMLKRKREMQMSRFNRGSSKGCKNTRLHDSARELLHCKQQQMTYESWV